MTQQQLIEHCSLRRSLAAMAFFLGLIGSVAMAQEEAVSEERRAQFTDYLEEMVARLELSEQQQTDIEPIIRESVGRRQAIMESYGIGNGERPSPRKLRGMRGEMQDLQQETQAELSEILTDEQMDEYLALQEERQEKMREEMKRRMGR
ncbi:MAG: hypothetical protein AAGL66_16135 [Pseudomonadota bacterium]